MSKAFFICGIGTNVGKSVVCAGLLKNLVHGQAIKVIQTGECLFDQDLYSTVNPGKQVSTLRHYTLAASPHLAAKAEGQTIDLDSLAEELRQKTSHAEITLVEGSGGLMVPLSGSKIFLDFMEMLDYPVILTINNTLGAINQSLLSIEALKRANVTIEGLIFTHPDPDYKESDTIAIDNIDTITAFAQAPALAIVPHIPELPSSASHSTAWLQVAASLKNAASQLSQAKYKANLSNPPGAPSDFDYHHLWHPYSPAPGNAHRYPLVEKTENNYIHLKNGKKLLDGMSSWWCAIHGYRRPELLMALKEQAEQMPHIMFGGLTHEPAIGLGKVLLNILPSDLRKIFLADSGSVAVEVALQMAIQYWQGRGVANKTKIISHYGGYHGDTLGAMSVSDPINGMHSHFKGFLPKQVFLPQPPIAFSALDENINLNYLKNKIEQCHHRCAAVIVEPIVQGAGGMWFYHPGYLRKLRQLCDEYELLLICDEIATGFGRTGKMLASDWAGISPDIICLGKALTGGTMTLAATVCSDEVAKGISQRNTPLMHGATFMGNPLACQVAQASLNLLLTSNWAAQTKNIENNFEMGLSDCRNHNQVKDVRVLGAIGVVEMKHPVNAEKLREYFIEHHEVWIRPFRNLIYLMPPYGLSNDECARLCQAVRQAIEGDIWV